MCQIHCADVNNVNKSFRYIIYVETGKKYQPLSAAKSIVQLAPAIHIVKTMSLQGMGLTVPSLP